MVMVTECSRVLVILVPSLVSRHREQDYLGTLYMCDTYGYTFGLAYYHACYGHTFGLAYYHACSV